MDDGSQAEVTAFLADPANHGGASVQRIDTHISAVFLAGERVFKLKKAVALPFLDFAPLESRRLACQREVTLNRRTAPGLYLGVRAVTRGADGSLGLDGEGAILDWLVEMRRFDEDGRFDRLAEAGRLDRPLLNTLVETVVDFHAKAARRPDKGGRACLAWTIDTNAASMAANVPAILPREGVAKLAESAWAELETVGGLLEARRLDGLVRECHGDLHLGNICLFDGRPTPFDAIEFSDEIACIDVFYDLAFLLMDLDRRAGRRLASYALNHYFDLSGDFAAARLLPLFLSARAGVRAHVSASMAHHAEGARRGELEDCARAYLKAAEDYLKPPAPRLVAVGGLSGSGKSRMARELAPFLGVPGAAVVRTDSLRKRLMGVPISQRLGPEGYAPEITRRTYEEFAATCAALLADGHAVIADAVFARPEQRLAIEAVAARAGIAFDGLWLEAPPEIAASRIETRKANVSDATRTVLEQQQGYDLGPIAWTRIDTGVSKDEALAAGRSVLRC